MQGAILYGPHDVCFEERDAPTITKPTNAVIRITATCRVVRAGSRLRHKPTGGCGREQDPIPAYVPGPVGRKSK